MPKLPLWLSRGRGGMLCQTNSDVISVDILCFPLHQVADLLFHILHFLMEHAGGNTQRAVAQNDNLLHAVGSSHTHPPPRPLPIS